MQLLTLLQVEMFKVRRSKIFGVSLIVAVALPVIFGLVLAGRLGVNLPFSGHPTWQLYAQQLQVLVAVGGLIGFGFLFSWLFGREYSDGTITDLLALPLPRASIALAKLITGALWCAFLAIAIFITGVATARGLQIGGITDYFIILSFRPYAMTTLMVINLSLPVAWAASRSRGYLTPLALVILTLVVAQFGAALGVGTYIPWSVPSLHSGAAGVAAQRLGLGSLLLPHIVGLVGVAATIFWWTRADHS